MCDCLKVYITNWPSLMKICEDNCSNIDSTVQQKVLNLVVKRPAEDLLARLEPIAVALDTAQSDQCKIADVTKVWKNLETSLPGSGERAIKQKWHLPIFGLISCILITNSES